MDNSSLSGQSSGEIQNASSTMEYQQNNHVFSASFRNMQLKKIKRAEKKGTESVMDEKFALFFYTTTTVNDFQIRVWTLSLPVVVIVHGNQEPQSWATITWDNAFAEIVRDPFMITDRVTWAQLSVALNIKFGSYLAKNHRGTKEKGSTGCQRRRHRHRHQAALSALFSMAIKSHIPHGSHSDSDSPGGAINFHTCCSVRLEFTSRVGLVRFFVYFLTCV